jgi:hypothetical protein
MLLPQMSLKKPSTSEKKEEGKNLDRALRKLFEKLGE